MKNIFETIIREHRWRDVLCGTGSTVEFTQPLRNSLKSFFEHHKITSMLDAPCGDYSWMNITPRPDNMTYIGADIVEFMIQNNRQTYPEVDFRVIDISSDPLPAVDLLFCRDCLIHFSTDDIHRTFQNIANSDIKYVMLTTYDDSCYANNDISTGSFRPISFTKAPYNLGRPIDTLLDWVPGTNNGNQIKHIALWSVDSIKQYINSK